MVEMCARVCGCSMHNNAPAMRHCPLLVTRGTPKALIPSFLFYVPFDFISTSVHLQLFNLYIN